MTKRLKKLTVAIAIGVVLIAAGIISGVCIINSSVNKRPTYVATAEELVAAINDDIDKPIVLNNDIVVHGDLAANKLFDLEMNDHNLRVIGTFTLKTDAAGEMYVCDGKNQIKKRERVQADKIVIDAVNATITWNANVQLKNGYTADDFVVSSADHTFIFNGLMISESGDAVKTAMTVKQGRVVVSASDENVKAPAEIVVPADAKDAYVDNKTEAEVNIKASASVSVAGTVSVDIDDKAENVKITAPEAGSSVTVKSGTAASVEAAGSDVIVDKGATVAGKVTAGKVENNGTVGEIDSDDVTDNSVAIRKADAKTELSAYALAKGKDNYSANGWEAIKACVTAGNTAIDAATDIDGANAAFAAAKAEIDKVKTAEQEAADALANKKTETLAALDEAKNNYKETDYREAEWKNVTDAYDAAKAGIEAVTDINNLPGEFVKSFTDVAKAQKTIAQLELEEAKTAALANLKTAYENYNLDDYREEQRNAITAAYNTAKTSIENATKSDELAQFVENFTTTASAQKTDFALYREEAIAGIKDYVNNELKADDYFADKWKEIQDHVRSAEASINTAPTKQAVDSAANSAYMVIRAVTTVAQYRNAQKDYLDEYVKQHCDLEKYSAENKTAIEKAVTDGKTAITDADKTQASIDKACNDAIAAIDKIIAQQALYEAKTAALTDLENCYTSKSADDYSRTDWAAIETAYNNGRTAINGSKTTDEVATSLSTAKTAINGVKKSYAIVYELNGGTNDGGNPERIYDDSTTTALKDATKENYEFMGWYKDEACTDANKVTALTYGDGVTKVYAKWGVNITASLLGVEVEEAVAPGDTFAAFLAACDDIMSYNIDEESGIELDGYYLMKADGTLVKIEADTVNDFSEPVTFYVVLKQNDVRYLAHSDGDNGIYTAEVIGLVSAKDDVTIVSELELLSAPHEVTEIASGAFADVDVKTAYIPATVEKIGASIFKAGSTVTVYTDKTADWADTSWKNGATVTVITKAYYASTADGIAEAMAKGGTIVLTKDLIGSGEGDSNTCIGVRAADGDVEIVLDLNGKRLGYELDLMTTIAGSSDDSGYKLKIKIINGKIGTDDGYSAADADGKRGQLYYGVLCQGNGVDLTLENVESSAYYGGLYANGQYKNNVITANNCVFKAACDNGLDGSGAYLPGQNTYKFTKCEFSGSVGVYIKSGNTTFTDCTITTNGTYVAPTYNGNGADGSGSALIVDSTKGYQTPMTVKVIGGTITSISGYAVEEVSNAKTEAEKICYSTTTISSTTVLSGGLGKVYSENGKVTVEDESGAKTAYASTTAGLATAMANGGTVVLTNDVVATTKADSELPIKAQYGDIETVIDLNGKALGYELQLMNTIDGTSTDYTLKVTIKNGKLGSQTENGKFSDGSRHEYGILMQGDKVDLTLENVEVTAFYAGLYGNGQYDGSKITATKCTFNGKNACSMYMPANYTSVFTDCTFSGTVYLKSGNTTFNNCVIDDTIVGEHKAPVYNASGSTGWGSGVIVDSCYGYQQPMIVNFNGGSIKSALGYAIEEASTAPAGKDKVSYATVTVSKDTVLEGALGKVLSENDTVTIEQA